MKIKVCGLKDPENIKAISALSPDYMGFICYGLSPRFIAELEPEVLEALPDTVYKTAVFVNESKATIDNLINQFDFNAIQLHGDESPEFSQSFKPKVKVFKAFGVDDDFDFNQLGVYADSVDYFMFDTKTEGYGGSGRAFNWNILENYTLDKPFFICGGISLDNLERIAEIKHPRFYGVDLNSRFETEPGKKDVQKLTKAFEILRQSIT
ncbi:phosphoribosylanthranilate isomerase [Mucilaginibacter paludis]|uniref:N-(5'-phosphoribosyl)anthranilate isomerase n=1 Tax=Mucilaginibacter paludis DSM 18603 TaxID=714943 RepID=H1Y1R5_9SPHI|nr:phosphoribosylanthranilate isomerase [Mucilaginibacter paludis]EHQ24724.1 N-(5'phosphoribosyl)anthranilate isomerase (PRAI) [Mucilaginibacter paludis DSM 18603]